MKEEDSLQPPRLASWLLEKFSPVIQNAPLAGDLIEAFKQGRSAGWYRRQVFAAIILGLLNFLRKQWGCITYAACCSGASAAAWPLLWSFNVMRAVSSEISFLYQKGYGMQWPWSLLYFTAFSTALSTAFQCATVVVALSVYVGLFRSLNARNLLRALPVVIVTLAIGNAILVFLAVFDLGLQHARWLPFSMVSLIALSLGIWKVNPGGNLRPSPSELG